MAVLACSPANPTPSVTATTTPATAPTTATPVASAPAATAPGPTTRVASSYRALGWFDGVGYYVSRNPERAPMIVGLRIATDGGSLQTSFRVPGSAGPLADLFERHGARMVVARPDGEGLLFYATPSADGIALEGKRATFSADGQRLVTFGGSRVTVYDGRTSAERDRFEVTTEIGVGRVAKGRFVGAESGLCVVDLEQGAVLLDEASHAAGWSPDGRYAARLRQRPRAWRVADLKVWDLRTMKVVLDASVGAVIRGADQFSFEFFGAAEQHLAIGRQGPNWREPAEVVATADLRRGTVAAPPKPGGLAQAPPLGAVATSNELARRFARAVAPGRRPVGARLGPGRSHRTAAQRGDRAVLVTSRVRPVPPENRFVEPEVVVIDVPTMTVSKHLPFTEPEVSPAVGVDLVLAPTGRHFWLGMAGPDAQRAYVVDIESEQSLTVEDGSVPELAHGEWRFSADGKVLFSDAAVVDLASLRRFDLSDLVAPVDQGE